MRGVRRQHENALPSWIEFHGSTVTIVAHSDAACELTLDAHVHRWEQRSDPWAGSGWIQPVRIMVRDATNVAVMPILPSAISAGSLRAGNATHRNLLPLPFESTDEIVLSIQLVTGGVVDIAGSDLRVELVADGWYVEELSEELRPNAG
jgi:hypothetical protein